jgi:hypothetical protein
MDLPPMHRFAALLLALSLTAGVEAGILKEGSVPTDSRAPRAETGPPRPAPTTPEPS